MTDPAQVAFFRNLNLGQRRSPNRDQLLSAFADAGAVQATSFQANGTVVFASRSPRAVAEEVVQRLTLVCGYADSVVVRPVPWVLALGLDTLGPDAEVSVFDSDTDFPEPLPWHPARGGLTVIRADRLHAVSFNDVPHTSGATPALEQLLGLPVTSRGVPTMLRLAVRLR